MRVLSIRDGVFSIKSNFAELAQRGGKWVGLLEVIGCIM